MGKKKTKIEKGYSNRKKASNTIKVSKKLFDKISNGEVGYMIFNDTLSFKLGKAKVKYKSKTKSIKILWMKWMSFEELSPSEARYSGYDNIDSLEKELKKEKSGLRSNSPVTLVKID